MSKTVEHRTWRAMLDRCKDTGKQYPIVFGRLRLGWSKPQAFTVTARQKRKNGKILNTRNYLFSEGREVDK